MITRRHRNSAEIGDLANMGGDGGVLIARLGRAYQPIPRQSENSSLIDFTSSRQ